MGNISLCTIANRKRSIVGRLYISIPGRSDKFISDMLVTIGRGVQGLWLYINGGAGVAYTCFKGKFSGSL